MCNCDGRSLTEGVPYPVKTIISFDNSICLQLIQMRERNVNKIYNIYKIYTLYSLWIHPSNDCEEFNHLIGNWIQWTHFQCTSTWIHGIEYKYWILTFPHFLPVQTPITNKEYSACQDQVHEIVRPTDLKSILAVQLEKRQSTWYEKSKHMYICMTPKSKDCHNAIIATDFATLLRWFKVSITPIGRAYLG